MKETNNRSYVGRFASYAVLLGSITVGTSGCYTLVRTGQGVWQGIKEDFNATRECFRKPLYVKSESESSSTDVVNSSLKKD